MTRTPPTTLETIERLWKWSGLPEAFFHNSKPRLELVGSEGNVVRSGFRIGLAAQACIASVALASEFYKLLENQRASSSDPRVEGDFNLSNLSLPSSIKVDARHAVLECASERFTRVYQKTRKGQVPLEEMIRDSRPISDPVSKDLLGIPRDAVVDWDPLAGIYETRPREKDGARTFVRIHTNFPHHKAGILKILGLLPDSVSRMDPEVLERMARVERSVVEAKIRLWDPYEFEKRCVERGMCATAFRTSKEWDESEMGKSLREWMEEDVGSPFRITEIESGRDTESAGNLQRQTERPKDLGHLRVIDMSRVIAAPVCARVFAAYGAKVLLLSSPNLPNLATLELDTARGKRAAYLDLDEEEEEGESEREGSGKMNRGREKLKELIKESDIFLQAYRPQGLASRGFSAVQVANLSPGIVYAELRAYGFTGPWSNVRGFDSLTQTATGINHQESESFTSFQESRKGHEGEEVCPPPSLEPRPLPLQALDHLSSYLLAFSILSSKCRQSIHSLKSKTSSPPPSYHVQLSLASVSHFLKSLGVASESDLDLHWSNPSPLPTNPLRWATLEGRHDQDGLRSESEQGETELKRLLRPFKIRRLPPTPSSDPLSDSADPAQPPGLDRSELYLLALAHSATVNGHEVKGWDTTPGHLAVDQASFD